MVPPPRDVAPGYNGTHDASAVMVAADNPATHQADLADGLTVIHDRIHTRAATSCGT
ncbi:hypothetical protein [Salinisphaera sp. Q1T1-3]|uniref:hypothetical protein n=1 Tax=Salinisphaera sp. Q1T1-3 TaxID=2321229 RepID=UPI001314EF0F|nr:hypothetical protein [Salinisphaera sp. Q1T1-3]